MDKKIIIIISLTLLILILSGCGLVRSEASYKKEQIFTIKDIELMYENEGIDIATIVSYNSRDNINYALVETDKKLNNFIWYNLENGDSYILPTGKYKAELKKIESQNNIVFEVSNKKRNNFFILECKRRPENKESRSDFIPEIKENYHIKDNI